MNVPVHYTVQYAEEMVFLPANTFHFGFSLGHSVAIAINTMPSDKAGQDIVIADIAAAELCLKKKCQQCPNHHRWDFCMGEGLFGKHDQWWDHIWGVNMDWYLPETKIQSSNDNSDHSGDVEDPLDPSHSNAFEDYERQYGPKVNKFTGFNEMIISFCVHLCQTLNAQTDLGRLDKALVGITEHQVYGFFSKIRCMKIRLLINRCETARQRLRGDAVHLKYFHFQSHSFPALIEDYFCQRQCRGWIQGFNSDVPDLCLLCFRSTQSVIKPDTPMTFKCQKCKNLEVNLGFE